MARASRELKIEHTANALADLDQIWEWNADKRGVQHATQYIAFLLAETSKLASLPTPGFPVPTSQLFRYSLIRRRSHGQGHLVVFTVETDKLRVLRYLHTSQNWEETLADDSEP